MPVNHAALRSELDTDPAQLGYEPAWSNGTDNVVASLLNFPRDGVTAAPNGVVGAAIQVRRADVMPAEILEVIDARDFQSETDAGASESPNMDAAYFASVMQSQQSLRLEFDDGSATRVLTNLRRFLQNPGPQGSRDRLLSIVRRTGSRAEQLFGGGSVVTDADVAAARAITP